MTSKELLPSVNKGFLAGLSPPAKRCGWRGNEKKPHGDRSRRGKAKTKHLRGRPINLVRWTGRRKNKGCTWGGCKTGATGSTLISLPRGPASPTFSSEHFPHKAPAESIQAPTNYVHNNPWSFLHAADPVFFASFKKGASERSLFADKTAPKSAGPVSPTLNEQFSSLHRKGKSALRKVDTFLRLDAGIDYNPRPRKSSRNKFM